MAGGHVAADLPNLAPHGLALSGVSAVIGPVVIFNYRHGIAAVEPFAQVQLRATVRTKRMELHLRRFFAHGAGPPWLKGNRLNH